MEALMDSKDFVGKNPVDVRLMSPVERSILHQAIVLEARAARAAAIREALRSLPKAIFGLFAAGMAALQRRRLENEAVAELRAFSDYALSDLGITRSEIRQRVQLPDIPGAAVSARSEERRVGKECMSR